MLMRKHRNQITRHTQSIGKHGAISAYFAGAYFMPIDPMVKRLGDNPPYNIIAEEKRLKGLKIVLNNFISLNIA